MTRGTTVPHYERHADLYPSTSSQGDSVLDDDDDAMDEAAQALREAEVEAVQPGKPTTEPTRLEDMSIDELRALAAKLDVPNRGAITEQDQLIAAIRERLQAV
jgi:hypothetical protein